MRNLKRALSLTLASVMLLGMMVVGSSAAAGYDDVKETDNVEAIEVLQAVEVMVGDDRGFGPDRPVNRAEMAVVMGKLLNLDYNYYVSTCPFTDVSGNYDWAKGWVGACAANGIVSGRGNGVYDPGATVTAVEAASMMMRALGYFKYTEDYADGFNVVTVRQGSQIGIFNGVGTDANTPMTRNQVAQMALNALESEMVTFTGTPGVNVNGVNVSYRAEYTPRTSTESKYQAIERRTSDVSGGNNLNRGQYYIQLGEELYNGDLVKRDDTDAFERPSNTWLYKSKEIGTYVDYDLLVAGGSYTDEVKYSELYDLLTYTTIRDYDLNRFVDGVEVSESKDNFRRSNSEKVGGRGVLTEVFVDKDTDEITITSINTYLAKANTSYSTNTETASLKVYTRSDAGKPVTNTYSVDVDDVPEVEGVEKDEFMLVYLSGKDGAASTETDYNRFEVVNLFDTEIMSDAEVTKFSTSGTKVVDKLTTGGTEYKTNPKAFYDKDEDVLGIYDQELLSDTTYNIYMDRYENVIGVDLYDGSRNYVFITGFDRGNSHISTKTADAAAIFLDGTMETITVNVTDTDKNIDRMNGSTNDNGASGDPYFVQWQDSSIEGRVSENRWYTYTVSGNGTYTLKPAARMFATDYDYKGDGIVTLDSANLYVQDNGTDDILNTGNQINPGAKNKGRAYGEDESVYITVETGAVDKDGGDHTIAITDVQGVYKGAQDVKMDLTAAAQGHVPNAVYTLYDSDSYIIAAIVVGEARGASANYAYITSGVKSERVEKNSSTRANDYTYYWEFEAFYNGEIQTLTAKTDYPATQYDLDKYTVRELRFNGEYVSDVVAPRYGKIQNNNTDNSRIDDMDVYDVGQIAVTENDYWPDTTGNSKDWYVHGTGVNLKGYEWDGDKNNPAGDTEARLEGTIYLQGRTLYIEQAGRRDIGLALGRDIPALLVQNENRYNNDPEKRVYTSVDEAVSNIADCSSAAGTQFRGRIAAALDGKGVAQWVVIISDKTLWTGKDPNYNVTSSRLTWNEAGEYWDLYIPGWKDGQANSATVIRNALADCGCTNISRTGSLWNFTYAGTEYALQIVNPYDNGQVVVPVTGVTLNETEKTVKVNEKFTLTATVSPSNATNKTVTWESSDEAVATVDQNGKVTAKAAGEATITATADGVKAECTVTVTEAGKPVGDPVTITFNTNGSAVKGTNSTDGHYFVEVTDADGNTSVKTDDSFKMKVGETLTIRAGLEIYVHQNGGAGKNVAQFGRENIMPEDDMEIYVNAAGFIPGDNNSVSWGEVWATGETPFGAAAVASMMAYARMTSDNFAKIRFSLAGGKYTDWYTVKILNNGTIANGPWQFGKNVDIIPLLGQLNASLAQRTKPVATENENNPTTDDIAKWNGETTEPTTVDPRTLEVQAVLGDKGTTTGNDETVTFKVYFGVGADFTTAKTDPKATKRTVTPAEITKALAAVNREVQSIDMIEGKAVVKVGNDTHTIKWTTDGTTEGGLDPNGMIWAVNNDGVGEALIKVSYPDGELFLDRNAAAGYELPIKTAGLNYLLPATTVSTASTGLVTVGNPKAGVAKITSGSATDITYVEAFHFVVDPKTTDGTNGKVKVDDPAVSTNTVTYTIEVRNKDNADIKSALQTAGTGFTDGYIQRDAIVTLTVDGTPTVKAKQTVTVELNGETIRTGEVKRENEAPEFDEFAITSVKAPEAPATIGSVELKFKLSPVPVEDEREKIVMLNGTPVTQKDSSGAYILRHKDIIDNKTVFAFENVNGNGKLTECTKTSTLGTAGSIVYQAGLWNGMGTAKYSWDDADAQPFDASDVKDPAVVSIWTVWKVDPNGAVWSAARHMGTAGDLSTAPADQITAAAPGLFKTTEAAETILVKATAPGSQLWFKTGTHPTNGAVEGTFVGLDTMNGRWNTGANLDAAKNGIWAVTVDKNINKDNLVEAYKVTAADADDTAKYGAETLMNSGLNTLKVEMGKWYDLNVKIGGVEAKNIFDATKSVLHKKNASDQNNWEFRVNNGILQIRVMNSDNRLYFDDPDTAGKFVDVLNGSEITIPLVGEYYITVPLTAT